MLPIRTLTKSISSFNGRQQVMQYNRKRCYCSTGQTTHVIEKPAKDKRKKSVVEVDSESQDVILNFFNNCDYITLNKLISFKLRLFKDYSLDKSMAQVTGHRYSDIEDFLVKTGVEKEKLKEMANTILSFESVENSKTAMKCVNPPFKWKNVEDIDKVVVLDIFHKDFAWCVRDTSDGYITDIGFKKICLKNSYDHVNYHNQIRMLLKMIPESQVYLLRTNSFRKKMISKHGGTYAVNQALLESLIITLLNERHQPTSLTEKSHVPYSENESNDQETIERMELENRVYLFEPVALKDFYDVTFQKELLAVSSIFKKWYLNNHANIVNWGLDTQERKDLFMSNSAGQVSVCALMADVFYRTLKKRERPFPHAYTSKSIDKYFEDN